MTSPAVARRSGNGAVRDDLRGLAPSRAGQVDPTVVPAPSVLSNCAWPPRLLREAVDLAETQARALADVLGREERFEGPRQRSPRPCHVPLSEIATSTYGPGERSGRSVISSASRCALQVFTVERAAARHRVARVDREVQDRALELPRIEPDRIEAGIEVELDLDGLADGALKKGLEILEQAVRVDRLRAHHLPAGEGQELLGHLCAALGGLQARGREPLDPLRVVGLAHDHVEIADDDGEQVVEVVRDAAGELADGLHLLGLVEARLGLVLLRRIHDDAGHGAGLAGRVEVDLAPERDPANRAVVGALDAAVQVEPLLAGQIAEDRLRHGAVLRDHVPEELVDGPPGSGVSYPKIASCRWVRRDAPVTEVEVPVAHLRGLEGEVEVVARELQFGALGLALMGCGLGPGVQEVDLAQIDAEHDQPSDQRLQPPGKPADRAARSARERDHIVEHEQEQRDGEPELQDRAQARGPAQDRQRRDVQNDNRGSDPGGGERASNRRPRRSWAAGGRSAPPRGSRARPPQ